jgi:hypothetical protein
MEGIMTDLLEKAIAKVKQLPESEQDEVAKMILERLQPKDKLTSLWQKIDELGEDEEEPSMEEITAMVKDVRHRLNE